jgi:hypothetical protein
MKLKTIVQDLKDLEVITKKKRRHKVAKRGAFERVKMDSAGSSHFPFARSEVTFRNSELLADEAMRARIAASKRDAGNESKIDQILDVANRFIPRGTCTIVAS